MDTVENRGAAQYYRSNAQAHHGFIEEAIQQNIQGSDCVKDNLTALL